MFIDLFLAYYTVFIVFLVGLFVLVTIYLNYKSNKFNVFKNEVNLCYEEFIKKYDNCYYFSKRSYSDWQKKYGYIEPKIGELETYISRLEIVTDKFGIFRELAKKYVSFFMIKKDYSDKIRYLLTVFNNGSEIVGDRNSKFIENEKKTYSMLFNDIDEKSLTNDQINSLLVDEAINLVKSGADTDKTLLILGKIKYILEKNLANPDEVLLFSYERRIRGELSDKIRANYGDIMDVRTFLRFGLNILGYSVGEPPKVSVVSYDTDLLHKTIEGFLQLRMGDFDFVNKMNKYFSLYLRPDENKLNISTKEEYDEFLRRQSIRSLRGETVNSYEECAIANFLYLNQINYRYEEAYPYSASFGKHRQYTPDFYLPDHGIWIEHIYVDRNCNTSTDIDKWDYLDSWYWQRSIHNQYMTECLETYSYQQAEGNLINSLSGMLSSRGVSFNKLPPEMVYQRLQNQGEISLFVGLISKFLLLFNSSNLSFEVLRYKVSKTYYSQKYLDFIDIFELIFLDYKNMLHQSDSISFDDMINKAVELIEGGSYVSKFKYILVDEFQVSQSSYRLIKALLELNPESRLFAVGDDWQSVNEFAGNDLSFIKSFDEFFEFKEKMYLKEIFEFDEMISD